MRTLTMMAACLLGTNAMAQEAFNVLGGEATPTFVLEFTPDSDTATSDFEELYYRGMAGPTLAWAP